MKQENNKFSNCRVSGRVYIVLYKVGGAKVQMYKNKTNSKYRKEE